MTSRRSLIALAAIAALSAPGLALAQAKIKVAAIYTVPFEQQWVSRIHKALKAAEAGASVMMTGGRDMIQPMAPTPMTGSPPIPTHVEKPMSPSSNIIW